MEPFADMGCVLKVNQHCDACKKKMMELLSSIIGVYSVSMDAPRGLVKVTGEVDPNRLINALATTGKHAEVVWVSLKHPQVSSRRRTNYINPDHASHGNSNGNRYNHYSSNYITPGPAAYYSCGGVLEDPSNSNRRAYNNRWWSDDDYSSWDTYHDRYYCPMTREVPTPEYYYNYHDSRDLPPARYVPSYPPPESNPYEDEPINLCSIM